MSDLIGTWQLPPVAGVNEVEVELEVIRPSIQAAPLRVLGSFEIGATVFNKSALAPGSFLVSSHTMYYQDPATFQKVVLIPEPGDIWQLLVSVGDLQTGAASPSAASSGIQISADGKSAAAVLPAFTEPQVDPRETLPAPTNVTLTWLP